MYLGHQTYGLGVVIAVLLIATGLGAAFGGRRLGVARRATVGIVAASVWLVLLAAGLPWLFGVTWSAPEAVRVGLSVLSIAPAGFFMGFPFPALLARLGRESEGAVAWCVGINSFLSVFATVLAIVMALRFGYTSVLVVGLLGYALALVAVRPLGS
jgi:hypothetical protein